MSTTIPGTNTIADISHFSGTVDLAQAKSSGLTGLFQKATQSTNYVDPTLQTNAQSALNAGLLFGTYHFGAGGDGAAQAQFYLSNVKSYPGLLVLDFEANTTSGETSMTVAEAEAFVQAIQQATGIWPGLYCGSYAKELLASTPSAILTNCWLWYSEYGPAPLIPSAWSAWTMWQYTDGQYGPDTTPVPGIGACDRETFNGDADALSAFWSANAIAG